VRTTTADGRTLPACAECGRAFDLTNNRDAEEWVYGHDCEVPKPCPLANDWRSWSTQKRADRLFMVCPSCGVAGSHVEEV